MTGAQVPSGGSGPTILTDSGVSTADGGPIDSDAACAAEARDSTPIVVDLVMMIDKSVSMKCGAADTGCDNPGKNVIAPTRWKAVTDSLTAFINAPSSAGIGAGVGFFALPDPNFCNVAAYATPAAAIAPLPASAANIYAAIAMKSPGGTTPTEPALQGAIDYAKTYTRVTPGRTAAVVFVTDGLPNGCNSTVAGAAMIAQTAFTGTPPIKTYVVGLGGDSGSAAVACAGAEQISATARPHAIARPEAIIMILPIAFLISSFLVYSRARQRRATQHISLVRRPSVDQSSSSDQ